LPNYEEVEHDYWLLPTKPVLDAEPRYEDHPIGFKPENGYFRAYDVRQAAYWNVFAGGCGTTYGHHAVWAMNTEPSPYFPLTWTEALERPAANQMRYLRILVESRPQEERVPDQTLVANPLSGADHIRAVRGKDYAFFYSATGQPIEVRLGVLTGGKLRAAWYDPRTGASHVIGLFDNHGAHTFIPPTSGHGEDWVLLLDDADREYGLPNPSK